MRSFLLPKLLLLLLAPVSVFGGIRLPAIIGDHMVVQQEMPVRLWGWAGAGDKVTVRTAGQMAEATAGPDGKWEVELAPLPVGGPYAFTIESGGESVVIADVLSGEVWLASGQSNMEWPVSKANDREEALSAAKIPDVRLFDVDRASSEAPQSDLVGRWRRLSPSSLDSFSAVAWNFGRSIHSEIDQPIGLISSAWGGTRIEPWMPFAELDATPEGREYIASKNYTKDLTRAGPAYLYNGMIHPIVRFPIRGVLWYQGESNAHDATAYAELFPAMIQAWRKVWGVGEFPFYYVELAAYRERSSDPAPDEQWAFQREAQQRALMLPNVGVASAIDVGEADDIHPRDKTTVGNRLARLALANVYNVDVGGPAQSPRVSGHDVQGNSIFLDVIDADVGLVIRQDDPNAPTGFAVAGRDGAWLHANVELVEGNKIRVWSDSVPSPVFVRYAWANNPYLSVFTKDGLPLLPFRTDSFQRKVAE